MKSYTPARFSRSVHLCREKFHPYLIASNSKLVYTYRNSSTSSLCHKISVYQCTENNDFIQNNRIDDKEKISRAKQMSLRNTHLEAKTLYLLDKAKSSSL